MNTQDKIKALREAGQVKRVHTVPCHGTYTNAEHVAQMLNLLFMLYPGDPPPALIRAIQFHDVAERWTGDIPGPMKYVSEELDQMCSEAEERCFKAMGIEFGHMLPKTWEWLRALDKIELWLWSHDQLAMGNQNADEIQRTLYDLFMRGEIPLPDECADFVRNYRWSRLSDMPPTGGGE